MAIALLQQTQQALTAVASQAVTIPATTAGSCLLVEVSEAAASTAVVWTPTATGATFTAPTATTVTNGPPPVGWQSATNSFTSFGYAFNVPSGITSVTIAQTGTAKTGACSITEWSGVATASAVDASTGSGRATATAQTTVALTTTTAGCVVVGAISCPTSVATITLNQATSSPASGWNALTGSGTNIRTALAYQVFTGTVTGALIGWTLSTTSPAGVCAIALKPAVAAVDPPARPRVYLQAVNRSYLW